MTVPSKVRGIQKVYTSIGSGGVCGVFFSKPSLVVCIGKRLSQVYFFGGAFDDGAQQG